MDDGERARVAGILAALKIDENYILQILDYLDRHFEGRLDPSIPEHAAILSRAVEAVAKSSTSRIRVRDEEE